MTIKIRSATAADQATILSLVLENNLNPFELHWSSFRVAVTGDDRVVGCGQIKQHGKVQELASLVVAKEWQGKGLSNLLMADLLDRAGRPLWLMCESPLVAYYLPLGFEEVKRVQHLPAYFQGIYWTAQFSINVVLALRGTYLAFMVLEAESPGTRQRPAD